MSFQVMHGYQGNIEGEAQGLGVVDPHQKRTNQSGTLSYRHTVQIPKLNFGFAQGGLDDGGNIFEVPP